MTITSTPTTALPALQNAAKNNAGAHANDDSLNTGSAGELSTATASADRGAAPADGKTSATAFGDLLSKKIKAAFGNETLNEKSFAEADSDITPNTSGNPVADAVNFALQQIGAALNAAQNGNQTATPGATQNATAAALRSAQAGALRAASDNAAPPANPLQEMLKNAASEPAASPAGSANSDFGKQIAAQMLQEVKSDVEAKPAPAAPINPLPLTAPASNQTPVQLGTLPVEIHSPRFAEATAERVQFAIGNKLQSAQIDLHPAELGPIRIQLHVNQQDLSISFTAAHADTRQALEQALPRLRELLGQSGITLTDAQVGQQTLMQQQQQPQQSSQQSASSGQSINPVGDDTPITLSRPLNSAQHNSGLLDTYA